MIPRSRAGFAHALSLCAVVGLAVLATACGGGDRRPTANVDTRATTSPSVTPSPPAVNVAPTVGASGTVYIETPGFPHAVRAGFGSLWVAGHRGGYLYRVDPRTNRVTAAINAIHAMCGALGVGGGAVWVGACGGGPTYKVDAATNRISDEFFKGWAPVYGAGSLWTASIDDGELLRLDPRSGLELKSIDPRFDTSMDHWHPMIVARGSMWVYSATAVSRVDPKRNRVTAVIPLRGSTIGQEHQGGYAEGGYAAIAAGRLWVTNPAGLYEIDPSTNTARLHPLRIRPFNEWGDIHVSAGKGDLWVRTSDSEVARIDPSSGRVVSRYPAGGGGGGGLTVAVDALWIANAARDRVARQDLRVTR